MEAADSVSALSGKYIVGRWILATCLGGVFCWIFVCVLGLLFLVLSFGDVQVAQEAAFYGLNGLFLLVVMALGTLLFFGLITGLTQRHLLRPMLGRQWLLASTIGWFLAFAVPAGISWLLLQSADWGRTPILVGLLGIALGSWALSTCQWLALPPYIKTAGSKGAWLVLTALGLVVGVVLIYLSIMALIEVGHLRSFIFNLGALGELAGILVIGLLPYSITTGIFIGRWATKSGLGTGKRGTVSRSPKC
jgi:hypothetical protein